MDASYVGFENPFPVKVIGVALPEPVTFMITWPDKPVTGSGAITIVELPASEMLLMLYVPGTRVTVLFPARLISLYSPGVGQATVITADVGQSVALELTSVKPGAGITGGFN